MRKNWIMILSIGLLIAMLTSCGDKNEGQNDKILENGPTMQQEQNNSEQNGVHDENADSNQQSSQNSDTTTPNQSINGGTTTNSSTNKPSTEKPSTMKPSENNTNNSQNTNSTQPKPNKEPAKPTTKPTIKPPAQQSKPNTPNKPAAKPNAPQKKYSISEVHNLVKKAYGSDYYANTAIPKDALSSLFGINLADVEEYIAEQPMISANIDTFVAIKAKNGRGSAVASALSAYKKSLTSQGACLYPSNIPKAQAGQVVRHGDYVFLVMLGAIGDDTQDEAAQLQFAKSQVAKGVSVINKYFAK